MPLLHLLAGSNGAGRSTYARDVLIPATGLPFINADEIALERWPDAQAEHAYEAPRIAETQRRERIAQQRSFITETVFSHPSKVKLVSDAVGAGYLVHLHIIIVPVELTVQRVTERVRRGGHAVPEGRSEPATNAYGTFSAPQSTSPTWSTCTTTAAHRSRSARVQDLPTAHSLGPRVGRNGHPLR
ncbi:hypothetical protein BJF84_04380 [Rhodococcus sp. CUA-806]|nr:hypothetical protein BJF84_04380 [Rhodococcus sp. CUA-806]